MAYSRKKIIRLDREAHDLTDELMQLSAVLDRAADKLKDEFEAMRDEYEANEKKMDEYKALDTIDSFNKRMVAIRDTHRDILNLLRQIGAVYDRGAEDLDKTIHDPHFVERVEAIRTFVGNI
ncbi:MAG: hypothetical protein K6B65_00920 [Bacilli bacterium]|nr:hypothetical protein [Bacilli bacterium]